MSDDTFNTLVGAGELRTADRRELEQIEQLQPCFLYEGLPIALFVLSVALRVAPISPWARKQAEQLLDTLRTTRVLPPYTDGWVVLSASLDSLAAGRPVGLLGEAKPIRQLPAYICAAELVLAGLKRDASHALFTGQLHAPDDDAWVPLLDERRRILEVLSAPEWAGIPLQWVPDEQQRALLGDRPALRNRILGAEGVYPLPAHMVWRITQAVERYVEADLSRLNCDWIRCVVILPGGVLLAIAVPQAEHVAWAYERARHVHDHMRRAPGWNVHVGPAVTVTNSPGATVLAPTAVEAPGANVTATVSAATEPERQSAAAAEAEQTQQPAPEAAPVIESGEAPEGTEADLAAESAPPGPTPTDEAAQQLRAAAAQQVIKNVDLPPQWDDWLAVLRVLAPDMKTKKFQAHKRAFVTVFETHFKCSELLANRLVSGLPEEIILRRGAGEDRKLRAQAGENYLRTWFAAERDRANEMQMKR